MLYQIFIDSFYELPNKKKTIVVDIYENTKILDIKKKIFDIHRIPIDLQILKFKNKEVSNKQVVSNIPSIEKDVILILYIKTKNNQ